MLNVLISNAPAGGNLRGAVESGKLSVAKRSKKQAKSKLPTGPYAQRAYAMAQWLTSMAESCDDSSAPPAARREFQKFWDVWTNMAAKGGAKDRDALLRAHLYDVCYECAQNLSEGYTADKATTLVIGAMRTYVKDAAELAKIRSQRARIRAFVLALSQGKSRRKEVTIKDAGTALFGALGLGSFETASRGRRRGHG